MARSEMPDEAEFTGSDVDIMVVTGATDLPKLGKFLFRDTFKVTFIWHELTSRAVFTNYHLANAFRLNTIIFYHRLLHELQSEVFSCFTHYEWYAECENARQKAMRGIIPRCHGTLA